MQPHSTPPAPPLLGFLGHQIRTPLNSIVGLSHLLAKTELTPLQRDYLDRLAAAGRELLAIVSDVQDYSKLEAGALRIEESDFDLVALFENVVSTAAPAAAARKASLIANLDPQLPRKLRGDRLRLGQMLLNFLNCAIDLTRAGDIAVSADTVAEEGASTTVRFAVHAGGTRLSSAEVARLADSRMQEGTRLGLVINERLAMMMGGTVAIESVSDDSCRFAFTVRLGVAQGAASTAPTPALHGRRALVVDDSFESRAALSDMLLGMSMRVAEARSGYEAIDEVRRACTAGEPFDIVYLDAHMPELDGFATASRIKSLGLQPLPALLMVSAYGREEILQRASAAGIETVLLKPVLPSTLCDTTAELLSRRSGGRDAFVQTTPAGPAAQPPAALQQIRDSRVLVVDDNEINQLVARAILEEIGIAVTVADHGRAALDALAHGKPDLAPDLVLMDLQMPVMDGLEATRELRRRGFDAPVVALTASAAERDRRRCLEAGMNDVLIKPIEPELLWQCVLHWIPARGGAAAGPAARPRPGVARLPLDAVPGVDLGAGLARVRGDEQLYRSLLARFVQQNAGIAKQIHDALANGSVGHAEWLAHKIRSVASSLGLLQVDATSQELEGALRAYAPPVVVQDKLRALAACLERTVEGIGRALSVA